MVQKLNIGGKRRRLVLAFAIGLAFLFAGVALAQTEPPVRSEFERWAQDEGPVVFDREGHFVKIDPSASDEQIRTAVLSENVPQFHFDDRGGVVLAVNPCNPQLQIQIYSQQHEHPFTVGSWKRLRARNSTDGGKSWSPERDIGGVFVDPDDFQSPEGLKYVDYGGSCMLALLSWNNAPPWSNDRGDILKPTFWFAMSPDDGFTWSPPESFAGPVLLPGWWVFPQQPIMEEDGGNLHFAWHGGWLNGNTLTWRIEYRVRFTSGQWGPIETPLGNIFRVYPNLKLDRAQKLHLVYKSYVGSNDLYHHAVFSGTTFVQDQMWSVPLAWDLGAAAELAEIEDCGITTCVRWTDGVALWETQKVTTGWTQPVKLSIESSSRLTNFASCGDLVWFSEYDPVANKVRPAVNFRGETDLLYLSAGYTVTTTQDTFQFWHDVIGVEPVSCALIDGTVSYALTTVNDNTRAYEVISGTLPYQPRWLTARGVSLKPPYQHWLVTTTVELENHLDQLVNVTAFGSVSPCATVEGPPSFVVSGLETIAVPVTVTLATPPTPPVCTGALEFVADNGQQPHASVTIWMVNPSEIYLPIIGKNGQFGP